ncbi:mucin TcMUCII, partial [Trypanosoma cruzi]
MVYLRLGNGNLRIQSRPVRLLGTTVEQILNCGPHASTAAKQTMPRRYQLRPAAQAGASHHAMRSFSIGYVHGVSLYGGKAILPFFAHTCLHNMEVLYRDSCTTSLGISAPTEDTSVCLKANLLPLRKILWRRAITQHERHVRFHNHEDSRSLIYSEPMPPFMHGKVKAATSIPLPKNAVINGLERVCGTIGIPHNHNQAPPITQHRIIPCDAVSSNNVEFYQPRFAKDVSDDVKRTAFDSLYSSLGDYYFELWTVASSSLAELASGSAALLYGPTKKNDLPVGVHRAAAGRLACSYRAECLAIENGFRHLIIPRLETS